MKNVIILILICILASLSQAEDAIIKSFSAKPNDWFQNFEFRYREQEFPEKVKTVIFIVTNDSKDLGNHLSDPKWQAIFSRADVGFAAVAFNQAVKQGNEDPLWKRQPEKAADLVYQEISQQIKIHFPRCENYGIIVQGEKTGFALRFIEKNSRLFSFWILEDIEWQIPAATKNIAPGLVINQSKKLASRLLETHQNNRLNKRNVLFVRNISSEEDKINDKSLLDHFMVEYILAMISPFPKSPIVVCIVDKSIITREITKDKIADTVVIPDEKLLKKWQDVHNLLKSQNIAKVFIERVETGIKEQPYINLYLKLPSTLQDSDLPRGVLCLATSHIEGVTYDILKHDEDHKMLLDWADENKFAVIMWNTAILWRTGVSLDELNQATANQIDKNFDVVALAWEKGVRRLALKYKLPEDGYFLYGMSRGAHWANRLVLRTPSRFLVVHLHIANNYDVPNDKSKNLLWLITSGELDGGFESSLKFYLQSRSLNYPIMLKAGVSLAHQQNKSINQLGIAFFDYALNIKNNLMAENNFVPLPINVRVADVMRRDLGNAIFFGDYVNQGVYEKENAEWIPPKQKIPLVSEKIADIWNRR